MIDVKGLVKELYDAESLSAPHPHWPGKESSLHREGLLLDVADALKAAAILARGCALVRYELIADGDSEGLKMARYLKNGLEPFQNAQGEVP